jgi:hypothetical protein
MWQKFTNSWKNNCLSHHNDGVPVIVLSLTLSCHDLSHDVFCFIAQGSTFYTNNVVLHLSIISKNTTGHARVDNVSASSIMD